MNLTLRKSFFAATFLFIFSLFFLSHSLPVSGSTLLDASEELRAYDSHYIEVRLDPTERRISGRDTITPAKTFPTELRLLIDRNIHVRRVELTVGSTPLSFTIHMPPISDTESTVKELIIIVPGTAKGKPITIFFDAVISPLSSARKMTERGVSFSAISVMGEEGVFLPASSYWFPRRSLPFAYYDVLISLPLGFTAVMEGELLSNKETESRSVVHYKTNSATDGVNLVAARFIVKSEVYKGIDISTYFYQDDEELSRTYIEKSKFYIDAYSELLPPYPYRKFAIVENFLPTGFGMPSYTLLGSAVLRLPFIPDTALGHEFAHNWWGNGVFIDASMGNWAEALTTYTADHHFKEREGPGEAAAYRLRALANYANYASFSDKPVSSFRFGTSSEARAIGYSKAMMIFHMLRSLVGDELFYASLNKFYTDNAFTRGSWDDIRLAFEEVSQSDLKWFFDQWLTLPGGPVLKVEDVKSSGSGSSYSVSLTIKQVQSGLYRLKVPILIETRSGELRREVLVDKESQLVTLKVDDQPFSVEVDPETDIFRILSPSEIPPSLASILGSKESVLILPGDSEARAKYLSIAEKIEADFSLTIKEEAQVMEAGDDLFGEGPSYFIFGSRSENALFDRVVDMLPDELMIEDGFFLVNGDLYDTADSLLVAAIRPGEGAGENARSVAILFGSLPSEEIARIGARIAHLTNKGFLVFTRGGGLKHGTFEGAKSFYYDLSP